MPTVHIPEGTFGKLVDQEGGYEAAKEAVIEIVKEEVGEDPEAGE